MQGEQVTYQDLTEEGKLAFWGCLLIILSVVAGVMGILLLKSSSEDEEEEA